jgi:hypothetical protein
VLQIFFQTLAASPELTNALLGAAVIIIPLVAKILNTCLLAQLATLTKKLERNTSLTERTLEHQRAAKDQLDHTLEELQLTAPDAAAKNYKRRNTDPIPADPPPPPAGEET